MNQKVFSSQFKQACYWKESTDWPPEVPSRDLPKTAQVVVIGSGFTGLSAARSLAKGGAQVVVLEKDEIGAGASSRDGGIVHPTLGVSGQDLIERLGIVNQVVPADELEEETRATAVKLSLVPPEVMR